MDQNHVPNRPGTKKDDRHVLWLKEVDRRDASLVGGKAANLGELIKAGLNVPEGFCVTTNAFQQFMDENKLASKIASALRKADLDDFKSLQKTSRKIRNLIVGARIPPKIMAGVKSAYSELGISGRLSPRVSIRSSAAAEDSSQASFAGIHNSFLNMSGQAKLIKYLKLCWASLWTPSAIYYRHTHRSDVARSHENEMAVIIQQMVSASKSGVMFTRNPVNDEDEIVINSTFGLGTAIVSGETLSDTYIIESSSLRLKKKRIVQKDTMTIARKKIGLKKTTVPKDRKNAQSLNNEQLMQLTRAGLEIERIFGCPQDLEFTFDDQDELFILQSRPITTLKKTPTKEKEGKIGWTRHGIAERLPDPASPMTFWIVKNVMMRGWNRAMKSLPVPQANHPTTMISDKNYLYNDVDLDKNPEMPSLKTLKFLTCLLIAAKTGINRWKKTLDPYMVRVKTLRQFDVKTASFEELMEHFREACRLTEDYFVWEIYMGITRDIIHKAFISIGKKLGIPPLQATTLIQTSDDITSDIRRELAHLANEAERSGLKRVLTEEKGELTTLKGHKDVRDFLAKLEIFLEKYGHRGSKIDWIYRRWGENPAEILGYIRNRLAHRNHSSEENRWNQEKKRVESLVLQKLKKNPLKRILFSQLLKTAREWTPIKENRQHYLEFSNHLIRRALLELGGRLSNSGVFLDPSDIFFVTPPEIENIARIGSADSSEIKKTIDKRRKEWQRSFSHTPPVKLNNSFREEKTTGRRIEGVPGSSGKATGRARVIKRPEEFDQFLEGEILVTTITNPCWITLFERAKAVIADLGDFGSHCAVLAREYRIPAVVGTKSATTSIKSGEIVTVDGDKGIIYTSRVLEKGTEESSTPRSVKEKKKRFRRSLDGRGRASKYKSHIKNAVSGATLGGGMGCIMSYLAAQSQNLPRTAEQYWMSQGIAGLISGLIAGALSVIVPYVLVPAARELLRSRKPQPR